MLLIGVFLIMWQQRTIIQPLIFTLTGSGITAFLLQTKQLHPRKTIGHWGRPIQRAGPRHYRTDGTPTTMELTFKTCLFLRVFTCQARRCWRYTLLALDRGIHWEVFRMTPLGKRSLVCPGIWCKRVAFKLMPLQVLYTQR